MAKRQKKIETIEDTKDQSQHELILKLRTEAEPIIHDIRVAAETTGTEGWQRLYQNRKRHAKSRRELLARSLHEFADQLTDLGWDESTEKSVKDLAKEHAELRAAESSFDVEVARPVYEAVHRLERLYGQFRTRAGEFERDAALMNQGLVEAMEDAISQMPAATWDELVGVVRIREGGAS